MLHLGEKCGLCAKISEVDAIPDNDAVSRCTSAACRSEDRLGEDGLLTRLSKFGSLKVTHRPCVVKLSVSGIGLRSHTGVAIRMFRALADAHINIDMISTSEVRVNVVVGGEQGRAGLEELQSAFADAMR